MKIHIVTIGQPKLAYARLGWQEYWSRLEHYHKLRVTHLADKWAADSQRILQAGQDSFRVTLEITGRQFSSPELADFLQTKALEAREISFVIGGPDGLPPAVSKAADLRWSLGALTLPHDLAMVTLLEALYRASTLNAGQPYHR